MSIVGVCLGENNYNLSIDATCVLDNSKLVGKFVGCIAFRLNGCVELSLSGIYLFFSFLICSSCFFLKNRFHPRKC